MKRFLYAWIVSVMVLFLNGCGGDRTITSLLIYYLEDGYDIRYERDDGSIRIANFCGDMVHYRTDDGTPTSAHFFWITGHHIDVSSEDDETADWYWDISSPNASLLEVGVVYDLYNTHDPEPTNIKDIISIEKVDCR